MTAVLDCVTVQSLRMPTSVQPKVEASLRQRGSKARAKALICLAIVWQKLELDNGFVFSTIERDAIIRTRIVVHVGFIFAG